MSSAATQTLDTVQSLTQSGYKWGWETDIEMDLAPKGLNEDTIRLISARKEEPEWLLAWRLNITFVNTNPPVIALTNALPYCATIGTNEAAYFVINVPLSASIATNFLTASGDVDLC